MRFQVLYRFSPGTPFLPISDKKSPRYNGNILERAVRSKYLIYIYLHIDNTSIVSIVLIGTILHHGNKGSMVPNSIKKHAPPVATMLYKQLEHCLCNIDIHVALVVMLLIYNRWS